MAVYVAPLCWKNATELCSILRSENKNGFTCYVIEVRVTSFKWSVERRYKQFVELHEKMIKLFSVDKNLLPPKKLIGNRTEAFINERKQGLECYLRSLLLLFSILPKPLADFLEFEKYEVRFITTALSERLFIEGEQILSDLKPYEFSPLELSSISERLKLGEPTCYTCNPKQDIAHLIEFVTQLKHLKIVGSKNCFEKSSIIPNDLSYDLCAFKCIETLEVINCRLDNLLSVETVRKKVKSLVITKSLQNLSDILVCEVLHWAPTTQLLQNWPIWQCVTYANFSYNYIKKIDSSIKLLHSVKYLDLSYNEIEDIENLETLCELSTLILSHNNIEGLESLHTRLGNIDSLNLSSNKIKSLYGLSKLFSVTDLHLENNSISSIAEISHLCKLPCLEKLNLQTNPVTLTVDYRSQLLLMFGSSSLEITLDGHKATEKEKDTISVLQALQHARGETIQDHDFMIQENKNVNEIVNDTYLKKSENTTKREHNASKSLIGGLQDMSKFRHQVETLRRMGGSDWLRLLNEMHSSVPKAKSEDYTEGNSKEVEDYSKSEELLSKHPIHLGTEINETIPVSHEISYPECISSLDSTNEDIRSQLLNVIPDDRTIDRTALILEAKLLWFVLMESCNDTLYETPSSVLLHPDVMIIMKLNFMPDIFSSIPKLVYFQSISVSNISSINVGPCDAYMEIKINNSDLKSLIFLSTNVETFMTFVDECQKLYNIQPMCKMHPFLQKTFDFENVSFDFSKGKFSFQKQILFGQRVSVSKKIHKCKTRYLHYIFVTPSHVVLVEEKLYLTQLHEESIELKQQFHVCSLVNVYSNIKQIYLKDINNKIECKELIYCNSDCDIQKEDSDLENKSLGILHTCGSWLLIEFEREIILCLNFFTLKQRNDFLDTFLCVRKHR